MTLISIHASAGIAVGLVLVGVVYRLFFAPLSRFPGPPWSAISRLWMMYHEFKGDRTITIDKLHQKYGPVVRIAPDELSFNSADAVRDIYGIKSDLSKTDFYDMFIYYNERNTFTSMTKKEHSSRKRLVADRYTKSYVMQPAVSEGIREHTVSFMNIVKAFGVLDVYEYLHYFAMDAITNHIYGSMGTKTLTDPVHRPLVYDLSGEKHRTRLYLQHYFGKLLWLKAQLSAILEKIKGNTEEFHIRGSRLNAYGKDSVTGYRTSLLGKDTVATCAKLFAAVPDNDAQIAAECMDHLVAGVDTTGDAMCVLMWILSKPEHQHIQEKLFEELQTIDSEFNHDNKTAPIAALDALPYLDSVIREGLRWRAPVPMTLFRAVPPGGRVISGQTVPSGTVVGCQAYSLHRLPEVFENPDAFVPERWLSEDTAKMNLMKTYFWPFSSGARHCIGHNIAMVEMKMIIGSVYRYYRTKTTPGCTDDSMAMDDQLTSGVPYGLKCELVFEARS